ncbi:phage tail protein I [Pseudoalteromonas luteoviolacea]|uniref:Tail protein n=1 Tax=Pseudoalteromonas luteoviolacea H33 TaxID=1365251 RepID=A0A162ANF5_9GAMM|nr:phage tail protein I [Pseudoalteromonas luteoviolacea]KZN53297.1 tail protein [Pseudoalteromonas luteoviolacea H33]KZN76664.1 tail protein [Pseudoalteromonas luteoviolacea H33-S]MBQ4878919.1 phage tail protein I [Pseudoalteromonas luteoviolacea]MBQ4907904.1 phage tail protein I [Pseudoalteromonas luteoviolacea]
MSNFTLQGKTSDLELALEHCSDRILNIPVSHKQLWDPWRCPAQFLPWLADALSVDVWDSAWPEHVQRKVIADSVPRHRYKGTISAVNNALKVLNAKVELQEWWQYGGVPHSAKLLAIANENLDSNGSTFLSPKLQGQMWQSVVATKPMRTNIDFNIGVNLNTGTQVFGGGQSASVQVASHRDEPIFNFSPVVVGHFTAAQTGSVHASKLADNPSFDFNLSSIHAISMSASNHVGMQSLQDNPSFDFNLCSIHATSMSTSSHVGTQSFEDKATAHFSTGTCVASTAVTSSLSNAFLKDAPNPHHTSKSSLTSGAYTVSIQNITLNL